MEALARSRLAARQPRADRRSSRSREGAGGGLRHLKVYQTRYMYIIPLDGPSRYDCQQRKKSSGASLTRREPLEGCSCTICFTRSRRIPAMGTRSSRRLTPRPRVRGDPAQVRSTPYSRSFWRTATSSPTIVL